MVTTDWWNHAKNYKEILAGNDIRMPFLEAEQDRNEIIEKAGRNDMAACVKRLLEMIWKVIIKKDIG